MDLTDFGVTAGLQVQEVEKNEVGNAVCPVNSCHLGDRGPIELPGSVVLKDEVGDDATLESLGWACDDHDIQMPCTVTGPEANGLTSVWAGVPVEFADGNSYWVPVKEADLDDAKQFCHVATMEVGDRR